MPVLLVLGHAGGVLDQHPARSECELPPKPCKQEERMAPMLNLLGARDGLRPAPRPAAAITGQGNRRGSHPFGQGTLGDGASPC